MTLATTDVHLDENGWAQATRRSWRHGRPGPGFKTRRGLPWTPAEDRALLQRVAAARSFGYNDPAIKAAAIAHGRSFCAIATRLSALRAGIRLAMAAKGIDT